MYVHEFRENLHIGNLGQKCFERFSSLPNVIEAVPRKFVRGNCFKSIG